MNITNSQRAAISQFVADLEGKYTLEQYLASGKYWAKDSTVWRHIQQTGTGQLRLVCWYNNTYQPGGQEWKPAVIIQAVLIHLKRPITIGYYSSRPQLLQPTTLVRKPVD